MACSEAKVSLVHLIIIIPAGLQPLCITWYIAALTPKRNRDRVYNYGFLSFVVGSLLWYLAGFSIVFGPSQSGVIGNLDYALYISSHMQNCTISASSVTGVLFASFEMSFPIIATCIVVLSAAQLVSLAGALLIIIIWPLLVYYPSAHWLRGRGWLRDFNVLDASGSLCLHLSAGISALVLEYGLASWSMKSRNETSQSSDSIHNRSRDISNSSVLPGFVVTLLGWYSVTIGSFATSIPSTAIAFTNVHLTCCIASLTWAIALFCKYRQISLEDLFNGFIVGIAAVSSCAGYVEVWSAVVIGLLAGLLSSILKALTGRLHVFHYIPKRHCPMNFALIHAVPAAIGTFFAGVFSKKEFHPLSRSGAIQSNSKQILYQFFGIFIFTIWPMFWTLIISLLIRRIPALLQKEIKSSDITANGRLVKEVRTFENEGFESPSDSTVPTDEFQSKTFRAAFEGDLLYLKELVMRDLSLDVRDEDRRTLLHVASFAGTSGCVEVLLNHGRIDIHAKDRWGETALSYALREGHEDIIHSLLSFGANCYVDGAGDILCEMAATNSLQDIRTLVQLGVDVDTKSKLGSSALHIAASKGYLELVRYLVSVGASLNELDSWGNTPLNCSEMHEHSTVANHIEGNGGERATRHYNAYEICEMAHMGNLRMLNHMINNGANLNCQNTLGQTPVHLAASGGHLDVIEFLLEQPNVELNTRDSQGVTPLLAAIIGNRASVVSFLKSRGAEADERALIRVLYKAIDEIDYCQLSRLLGYCDYLELPYWQGQFLLHRAVETGRKSCVRIMLESSVSQDLQAANLGVGTPEQLAVKLGYKEIAELLKNCRQNMKSALTASSFFINRSTDSLTRGSYDKNHLAPNNHGHTVRADVTFLNDDTSRERNLTIPSIELTEISTRDVAGDSRNPKRDSVEGSTDQINHIADSTNRAMDPINRKLSSSPSAGQGSVSSNSHSSIGADLSQIGANMRLDTASPHSLRNPLLESASISSLSSAVRNAMGGKADDV